MNIDWNAKYSRRGSDEDTKSLEEANFVYLPWTIFDQWEKFLPRHEVENNALRRQHGDNPEYTKMKTTTDRNNQGTEIGCIKQEGSNVVPLLPFRRKKKILYISFRSKISKNPDKDNLIWNYMKRHRRQLSQQFDGFFIFFSCMYLKAFVLTKDQLDVHFRQIAILQSFVRRCYVMVASPYEEYNTRFWILWEILIAARNRKLVVNPNVIPLLKITGTNPSYGVAKELLKNSVAGISLEDQQLKKGLMEQLESFFYEGAKYFLIPIDQHFMQCQDWDSVHAAPLTLEHVDKSKVLMISHRWETEEHPDPFNVKLRTIQDFLKKNNTTMSAETGNEKSIASQAQYQHLFFDWKCINQTSGGEHIEDALVNVNELYSHSPCLCLCDKDYFERSWCLFEICINKFNSGCPMIIGEQRNHPVLDWLEHSCLVQRMGYVHAMEQTYRVVMNGPCPNDPNDKNNNNNNNNGTELELPSDQLHLKMQLRSLILASRLTNQGDVRIILNLLDKLIPVPS